MGKMMRMQYQNPWVLKDHGETDEEDLKPYLGFGETMGKLIRM
jgi:hypothetical protein